MSDNVTILLRYKKTMITSEKFSERQDALFRNVLTQAIMDPHVLDDVENPLGVVNFMIDRTTFEQRNQFIDAINEAVINLISQIENKSNGET